MQYRGTECLNCGHPLDISDRYCPYCSQKNNTKQLSLGDYFAEFISSVIVYDSRLRHTIRDLLFHPGLMSKKYVNGQRLNYANPFRFFLSVSIIYFLLKGFIGFITANDDANLMDLSTKPSRTMPLDSIPEADYTGDRIKAKEIGTSIYYSEKALDTFTFPENYFERINMYITYHQYHPKKSPAEVLKDMEHDNTYKNKWLYSRSMTLIKIQNNPNEFLNYVGSKIPFFLFFFAPFFALFFWLLYSKKKYTYMEHMIFIFHLFSFYFLLRIIMLLPELVISKDAINIILILIVIPLYFYLALRKFYEQKNWVTIIKFIFLSTVYGFSFLIAMIAFILGTVAVY